MNSYIKSCPEGNPCSYIVGILILNKIKSDLKLSDK
uniref:Peptidase_C39_2 domain-containing protein n=1 Tax=Strongyloides papillosus TaxID=174720 RepID=A0A0N5C2Z7_STREA